MPGKLIALVVIFVAYTVAGSEITGRMFDTEWSKRVNLDSPNYHSYPSNQPFIFDDYRRDPDKPVKAYPENSRKG